MADNVTLNAGSGGVNLMTDEITAGNHVQRVKPGFGVDGSLTDVSASNPFPVVQTGTPPLPTGAATETTLSALNTKMPSQGQAAMAASVPVTMASDQSAIPTTDGGTSHTVDWTGQKTSDYDSGAGTDTVQMVGIALPASGGAVQGGTSTNPIRTDPTGTTTQPVSGTVTITPSGTQTVAGAKTNNNAAPGATNIGALPAVANAAAPTQTEGNQVALRTTLSGDLAITLDGESVTVSDGGGSVTTDTAQLPGTLGQKSMANALAVSLASDQSSIPVAATLQTGSNVIGALSANQSVNMAQINGVAPSMGNGASGTGVQRVTIANDSTGVVGLAAGSNVIGSLAANQSANVAQINGVAPSMGNGASGTGVQRVTIANDSTGQVALAAGTATVGNVGLAPRTSGGCSMSRTLSAASTNATNVKASAGQVYGMILTNVNAAARFLKMYNSASAPTAGSGTPVMTIQIPGNTAGAGLVLDFPMGLAFSSGIGFTITGAVGDSDTTAVAANEIILNLFYT